MVNIFCLNYSSYLPNIQLPQLQFYNPIILSPYKHCASNKLYHFISLVCWDRSSEIEDIHICLGFNSQ